MTSASMSEKAQMLNKLNAVWPEHDGLLFAARKAAAVHLLLHPDRNSSSMVAHAVRAKLGASLKSLGLPPFKKVLCDEPCFLVQESVPEAFITLDSSKLQAAADRRVCQALDIVFPDVVSTLAPAETRVKRAVAQLLLKQPGYRARCSWVASAIDQSVGSTSKLGIAMAFRQLISSESCFKLTPAPVQGELYIKLALKELLHRAQQIHQQYVDSTAQPSLDGKRAAETCPVAPAAQPAQAQQQQQLLPAVAANTSAASWLAVVLSPPPSPGAQKQSHVASYSMEDALQQAHPRQGIVATAALQATTEALAARQSAAAPPDYGGVYDAAMQAFQAAALAMMPSSSQWDSSNRGSSTSYISDLPFVV